MVPPRFQGDGVHARWHRRRGVVGGSRRLRRGACEQGRGITWARRRGGARSGGGRQQRHLAAAAPVTSARAASRQAARAGCGGRRIIALGACSGQGHQDQAREQLRLPAPAERRGGVGSRGPPAAAPAGACSAPPGPWSAWLRSGAPAAASQGLVPPPRGPVGGPARATLALPWPLEAGARVCGCLGCTVEPRRGAQVLAWAAVRAT